MSDIVERLRNWPYGIGDAGGPELRKDILRKDCEEAADEIERLRKREKELDKFVTPGAEAIRQLRRAEKVIEAAREANVILVEQRDIPKAFGVLNAALAAYDTGKTPPERTEADNDPIV